MEASLECVWNRQNAKSSDLISSLALACNQANYELCRSWKVKNKTSDVRLHLHLCRRARNTKLIAFSLKVKQDMNSLLDLCNSHCHEYKSQESFVVYATALRALAPRKRFPPNGMWCRWKMKRFATALVIAENTVWQNLSRETKLSLKKCWIFIDPRAATCHQSSPRRDQRPHPLSFLYHPCPFPHILENEGPANSQAKYLYIIILLLLLLLLIIIIIIIIIIFQ